MDIQETPLTGSPYEMGKAFARRQITAFNQAANALSNEANTTANSSYLTFRFSNKPFEDDPEAYRNSLQEFGRGYNDAVTEANDTAFNRFDNGMINHIFTKSGKDLDGNQVFDAFDQGIIRVNDFNLDGQVDLNEAQSFDTDLDIKNRLKDDNLSLSKQVQRDTAGYSLLFKYTFMWPFYSTPELFADYALKVSRLLDPAPYAQRVQTFAQAISKPQ